MRPDNETDCNTCKHRVHNWTYKEHADKKYPALLCTNYTIVLRDRLPGLPPFESIITVHNCPFYTEKE